MRLSSFILVFVFNIFANAQSNGCTTAYDKMYNDGTLTMSVFYGYSDSEDYVDDRVAKADMVTKLTKGCASNIATQMCGFARDPDDADILIRTITRPNGKQDKVRLRLMSSAVSESHSKNTGSLKKAQDAQSKKTEDAYYRALETDDVVIYSGHARRGTGPGFKPMGNSDWISAATTKPNLTRLKNTLSKSKHKPAILGMITCEGESHYGKVLQDAAPNSGLLLTRQTTSFEDGKDLLDVSLNNILRKSCPDVFRKEIQATTQLIFNSPMDTSSNYKDKLPEIYNFFEVNSKKFAPQRGTILTYVNSEMEEESTVQAEQQKGQNPAPKNRPARTSQ